MFKSIIARAKFRTKALLLMLLIGIVPLFVFGFVIYNQMTNVLEEGAEVTLNSDLKNNSEMLSEKFQLIEDESEAMITDETLFSLLENGYPEDDLEQLMLYRDIRKVLKSHFDRIDYVYSAFLMTPSMSVGSNDNMYVPLEAFYESKIAYDATNDNGSLRWIPTYKFADMYKLESFRNISFSYDLLFSASRLIRPVFIDTKRFNSEGYVNRKRLSEDIDEPILLLQFRDEIFDEAFENIHKFDGTVHYVIDNQGSIISSNNKSVLTRQLNEEWVDEVISQPNGSIYIESRGEEFLLCYYEIDTTGWIAVVAVPYKSVIASIPDFKSTIIILMMIIILLSLIASLFGSNVITQPIKKILIVLDKMSQGEFHTRIDTSTNDEIGALYDHFNQLSDKMERLIQSEYISKINEKQATINALTSQIDPHFITNTLSTINWMAVDIKADKISKMTVSLSKMMDYTIRNKKDLVTLEEEIACLEYYLFIMTQRFEGQFIVSYDIDEEMLLGYVPKLLLQPLVENAINHGLKHISEGGEINIKCYKNEKGRFFSVTDNGLGIENPDGITEDNSSIGLSNIQKRIELLYGAEYGLSIISEVNKYTVVKIHLPM